MSWYVIKTKPKKEDFVEGMLKRVNFGVLNPKIKVLKGGKIVVQPLFPCYTFVNAELRDAKVYKMIKYTRGVQKILNDGIHPVALAQDIIDTIRERMDTNNVITPSFRPGQTVRVSKGPLKDLIGILEDPPDAKGRVKVLLKLMNWSAQLQCDLTEIEPLD